MGLVLTVMDYHVSHRKLEGGIERNAYGEGTKKQELEIKTDGAERQALEIEISEQMYPDEKLEAFFQDCISRLEKEMLGENESPDYVVSDLNLVSSLKDEPVEIDWKLDSYEVMNIYGKIQEENTVPEGTMVHLEAVLTYTQDQTKQMVYECAVVVYPKPLTQEEQFVRNVQEQIQKTDKDTQTKEQIILPETVDGTEVEYFQKTDYRGVIVMMMAILAGILFYAQELQNQGQALQKRKAQMLLDYPEIISKLTLFLGAGMTLKRAFAKVVNDYEMEKGYGETRYAYEEMKVTLREMESKVPEAECYEHFGKRCNVQEYMRLGALLSQSLRKGTKGLTHVLRLEAAEAFENRKARAKRLGEEAGTKLLIPMFLMLTVVLVMVIVPAFFSMQTQ